MQESFPKIYEELLATTTHLEQHLRDMQDCEFTLQDGVLFMLQTRNGKRTGPAALRVATDMVVRAPPPLWIHTLLPELRPKHVSSCLLGGSLCGLDDVPTICLVPPAYLQHSIESTSDKGCGYAKQYVQTSTCKPMLDPYGVVHNDKASHSALLQAVRLGP